MDYTNSVSSLRVDFVIKSKDLAAVYDTRVAGVRKEADLRREQELRALEDSMSTQIQVAH